MMTSWRFDLSDQGVSSLTECPHNNTKDLNDGESETQSRPHEKKF